MTGLKKPWGYFQKRAKALLMDVRSGDTAKLAAVAAVFRRFTLEDFTLMQSQHVVAVEHGFPSWGDLRRATTEQLYAAISHGQRRKKMDLDTQEQLRGVLRRNSVVVPEGVLKEPINAFTIYPVRCQPNASLEIALEEARQIAREEPWAFDIGNYQGGVDKNQAARIKRDCRNQGIPFWETESPLIFDTLRHPSVFPQQYADICEFFGTPVPSVKEE